jgi:plasmid stabilization system protein ParE
MRLRYTPRASRQLRAIARYLGERSPPAARTVKLRVGQTARFLLENPAAGRTGALPGTREFVVRGMPYIIVYRVEPNDPTALTILAVYHGAQLRPGQKAPQDD